MSPPVDDDQVRDSRQLEVEAAAENMTADSKGGDDSSDEESESDEEEESDDEQSKVSVKQLLDKILKSIHEGTRDLTRSDQFASFQAADGAYLASNTGDPRQPTALHIMAVMDKKALPKLDSQMEPLIKFLVQHRDNLLKVQDRSGHTPLFLAIEAKKERMVQWMCDAHASISTILAITSMDKMNCIHIGIDKRVKFLDLLVERADPATLAAKNSDGNTPLHLAVEYKNCRKEQLAIIERIVAKSDEAVQKGSRDGDFNYAGLSPFTHRKESVIKAAAKEKEKEKKRVRAEKEHEKGSGRGPPNPFDADGPTAREAVLGRKGAGPLSYRLPSISLPQNPDGGSRVDRRMLNEMESRTKYGDEFEQPPAVVNSPVVYVPPPSPGLDDGKRTTRQLEPLLKGGAGAKAASDAGHRSSKVDEATVRNVERFLKLHYLRSRSYNAAMEILYGRNTTSGEEFAISDSIADLISAGGWSKNILGLKTNHSQTWSYTLTCLGTPT